jgi:hypothetical protein
LKIYEDEDKARKEEIEALGGEDKVFSKFYDRLKEIREYHRKFLSNDLTEVSAPLRGLLRLGLVRMCHHARASQVLQQR